MVTSIAAPLIVYAFRRVRHDPRRVPDMRRRTRQGASIIPGSGHDQRMCLSQIKRERVLTCTVAWERVPDTKDSYSMKAYSSLTVCL